MTTPSLMGIRVAVTGANGYLGSSLVPRLSALGARVVGVSRRPLAVPDGVDVVLGDPASPSVIRELVESVDVIVHLAAVTALRSVNADPLGSYSAGVLPLVHMMTASRDTGRRPRVILASSATVYGLASTLPVDETCPLQPVTLYDQHKQCAEQQAELACRLNGVDAVVLRLANVYGPGQSPAGAGRGFLNAAAARALSGESLTVFGDGTYVRDYVHVDDVNTACAAAMTANLSGYACYNVGSGQGTRMVDALTMVAHAAARRTGRRVAVNCAPWPVDTDPIERRSFVASIERLTAATGWTPSFALDAGIESLVSSLQTDPHPSTRATVMERATSPCG